MKHLLLNPDLSQVQCSKGGNPTAPDYFRWLGSTLRSGQFVRQMRLDTDTT
jgi:hypothetical protein